jgi:hypothetical protein
VTDTTVCSRCGQENAASKRFCGTCGGALTHAPACGEENDIYAVNLRRDGDQLLIGVPAPQGADEETVVNAMAAEVLPGDERNWYVIYDQRQPDPPVDQS